MEAESRAHLAAIAALSQALDDAGVDHWLFGGWAVDFWVGQQTRPHDDVDLAAWRRDFARIKVALEAAGWRHTPMPDDVIGTRYVLGAVLVEFTFVESGPAGEVVVPLPDQPVVWSTEPFGDVRREFGAVSARVIPLDVLRAGKAVPREDASDAAKDRADAATLERVVE
ncbi:hypothetical protein [Kribbella sp. NPDC000426]|uniref:nucleotidyltransferase domain-containing protein n=1 Tax=Kribbella sp. NPDC000426 TaxID=3154255 RepID=UPI0033333108